MNRILVLALLLAGVLVTAFVAHAQEGQTAKEHSMTGCLAKGTTEGSFLLNNVEGTGPKSVGVVSSAENLAPHVGHKVTLSGTDVPAKEAEAMSTAPPKAPHYMKITAVKMVAATCS